MARAGWSILCPSTRPPSRHQAHHRLQFAGQSEDWPPALVDIARERRPRTNHVDEPVNRRPRQGEIMEPDSFPVGIAERLQWYVYRLIDPRNGETFYVGKGKGNRIFQHARAAMAANADGDA